MKILALLWLGVLATLNLNLCGQTPAPKDYTRLVDPFVGTGEHGHTYPGAVLPFGMVQVSPDTRMANWDGCSGYHHSDSTLLGFSHTHLSGTGAPELCDILLMPTTGAVQFQSGFGSPGNQGYLSTFRHNHEQATPGYYSVFLDKYRIIAELTATERTGFHRYTFPSSSTSNIIIDLKHRGNILESSLSFPDDSTITGHTVTTGWADQKSIYFFARFSKSFERKGIAIHDTLQAGINQASGTNLKAFVGFTTGDQEQVLVKIGLSAVSVEGARKNLMAENPGWDFQSIRESARCKWSRQLSRIEVTGGTDKEQRIFYTALYHTSLAPNLFMDVDSLFRGQDHKVHKAVGFTNYTVFSLWDVFRTQMPMFTLTEPQRMQDFLRSFLSMYQLGGRIPRFEIFGKLSDDMIGYHSLPVILDAWQKGITGFDGEKAFQAMKEVMEIPWFNNLGYIPADSEGSGGCVARVMEHCYNAWCVAEMARLLNHPEDQLRYEERAQYYLNLFDKRTGFMRPRNLDHSWVEPFDPAEPSGYYVEGNAFQYSAFVPHDIDHLIRLHGGEAHFVQWLDSLFSHHSKYDHNVVDAAGLIGQYAHGNEPSHQIAYLYDCAGAAPKTQKMVRKILRTLYDDTPGGISGNEDCGQMSAWYVMSALGIYPVLPGVPWYAVGSPLFDKAILHLENGRDFEITTQNNGAERVYIQSARLNGSEYLKSFISHQTILKGGAIHFEMGARPNPKWGTASQDRLHTRKLAETVQKPYCRIAENYFFDRAKVTLGSETPGAKIYYTLDGSTPSKGSLLFRSPFQIDQTTVIRYFACREGLQPSSEVSSRLEKLEPIPLKVMTDYSRQPLAPGLQYKYFEEHIMKVDELDQLIPKKRGIVDGLSIAPRDQDALFAFIWEGLIRIPTDGVYTFYLSCNDGGVLYLDGQRFIDQDGPHTAVPMEKTVLLKAGIYRIGEKYFQMGGAFSNQVLWKGPGIRKGEIPATVLFHPVHP